VEVEEDKSRTKVLLVEAEHLGVRVVELVDDHVQGVQVAEMVLDDQVPEQGV